MFSVDSNGRYNYDDSYVGPIDIPMDVDSFDYLFANKVIRPGCYIRHCPHVKSARGMFSDAVLPKDFHLGEEFAASTLNDTSYMFCRCKGFNSEMLKDCQFSKVIMAAHMFRNCTIRNNIEFSSLLDVRCMFAYTTIEDGVEFGSYMLANAIDASRMFSHAVIKSANLFGDKLIIGARMRVLEMFSRAVMHKHLADVVANRCVYNGSMVRSIRTKRIKLDTITLMEG